MEIKPNFKIKKLFLYFLFFVLIFWGRKRMRQEGQDLLPEFYNIC